MTPLISLRNKDDEDGGPVINIVPCSLLRTWTGASAPLCIGSIPIDKVPVQLSQLLRLGLQLVPLLIFTRLGASSFPPYLDDLEYGLNLLSQSPRVVELVFLRTFMLFPADVVLIRHGGVPFRCISPPCPTHPVPPPPPRP